MLPHHQQTIDRLTAHFQDDPGFPALIIGGSVVKGLARPDSDIDFVLVASDDEYARRAPRHEFHYFSLDFSDYPGGYVDGKIVDLPFLRDVAERGSEPARAAFEHAFVAYSRLPELADLLARITAYPEAERARKIQSFYAQLQALKWYIGEAEKRSDPYLLLHVVADMVLFGGRLILAYNRVLYPYHKWFMTELERAPAKPDQFMALVAQLLAEPCQPNADQFCDAVFGFTTWDQPAEGWPSRFMADSEWAWRTGCTPIADW